MGQAARKTKHKTTKHSKKVTKKPARVEPASSTLLRDGVAVCFGFFALFVGAALVSYFLNHAGEGEFAGTVFRPANFMGRIGGEIADLLAALLGWCSFVAVAWMLLLARAVWAGVWPKAGRTLSWAMLTSILSSVTMAGACAVAASIIFGHQGGGAIGASVAFKLVRLVNEPGALLVAFAVFMLSFGLATGTRLVHVLSALGVFTRAILTLFGDMVYTLNRFSAAMLRTIGWIFQKIFLTLGFTAAATSQIARSIAARRAEKLARAETRSADSPKRYTLDLEDEPEQVPINVLNGEIKISRQEVSRKNLKKSKREKRRKLRAAKEKATVERVSNERDKYKDFELPPLELLVQGDAGPATGPKDDELVKNSQRLERALADFRIGGKVVEVHPGPVITLYQFLPASGVKVQRIVNLADDLALALKVGRVRVYAPVPGKGTVGIEVPNVDREIVRLRDVLSSAKFQEASAPLEIALGKDTFGEPVTDDLARMPHLLIAGATGTGKSVCINSVLLSLLYRNTPDDLRLILIDPKMLELTIYERIPHLKAPVVTNPKHARGVLWWAVEEMDRRYQLMRKLGVRNLASYNRAVATSGRTVRRRNSKEDQVIELEERDVVATNTLGAGLDRKHDEEAVLPILPNGVASELEPLPRVVIVVDELADLMLTVGREIEELLTRLAQKARAAGIHLILATQRPSVNVITGLIKANFPSRISFQVASRIDARTVLDTSGAEKLLGQGDMLFLPPGTGRVTRLHSPFVSDREVQDAVEWICRQGVPDYDPDIENTIERINEAEKSFSGLDMADEYDALYDQAVQLVIEKGQASTSMVQRAFRIGYNRAARMLEKMESEGVVGPADGARPRQILVPNREAI